MSSSAASANDATILVVDDEPLITTALSRMLARPGWRVLAVNDPYVALELIASERVDLVITDKDMPQMSGHMLLDILKERHPDIPCVLLTGAASVESALVALNTHQVVRYLTKPWNPGELEETITEGLARRQELRAAAAARAVVDARSRLRATLAGRHPGLFEPLAADLALARSPGADGLFDLVRRLHGDDPTAELLIPRLATLLVQSPPAELAETLAAVPLHHPMVGTLITPSGETSRIAVDVRGRTVRIADVSRALGDAVAARLASLAGLDVISSTEQLGRIEARVTGTSGEVVVAYRYTALGGLCEVRRLMASTDRPASAAPPDQIGIYQLQGTLGEGGMGIVYRAFHRALERPVALKVLREQLAGDPITMARFLREARTATRARHPRIVETLDFGHLADGRPFLVMELITASTLDHLLRRGPLAPAAAIKVARGIAEALGAAHTAGVIHRDLKPGNVFVDDALEVKLTDFGAAKLLNGDEALTRPDVTLGTPSYMSPEHIMGRSIDGRTDLYALGCVTFHMLAGVQPYRGDNLRAVLAQHLQAPIPEVASPLGPVPRALVLTVHKAMAKDAADRHQTAAELITELDEAAAVLAAAPPAATT